MVCVVSSDLDREEHETYIYEIDLSHSCNRAYILDRRLPAVAAPRVGAAPLLRRVKAATARGWLHEQELRRKSLVAMQEQKALLKQQDGDLEKLGQGVQRVKALAGVMKEELQEQTVMLEDLEEEVDKTDTTMQSMSKKMKALASEAQNSDRALWSIIGCLLIVLAILVIMVLS